MPAVGSAGLGWSQELGFHSVHHQGWNWQQTQDLNPVLQGEVQVYQGVPKSPSLRTQFLFSFIFVKIHLVLFERQVYREET